MKPALDVAAALLRHPQTAQVLLTQRPLNKVRGGFWECPGGKIEPGESATTALARELREELGIVAEVGELRFIVVHSYPDLRVRLHVHEVTRWQGTLQALDVAALRWCDPPLALATPELDLAAADRQILCRLRLPAIYRITPDCPDSSEAGQLQWLERIAPVLQRSPELPCLFRVPALTAAQRRSLLVNLLQTSAASSARMIVSGDAALALEFGLGLHLTATQLANPPLRWAAVQGLRIASCHHHDELQRAAAIGCDAVTLSAVNPTTSHPHATALGWTQFQRLAEGTELPVYALGGVQPALLQQARTRGAIGVAGISAFWDGPA